VGASRDDHKMALLGVLRAWQTGIPVTPLARDRECDTSLFPDWPKDSPMRERGRKRFRLNEIKQTFIAECRRKVETKDGRHNYILFA
jgi:hypothetical protein